MSYDKSLDEFFQWQVARVAESRTTGQAAAVPHVSGRRKPSLSQQELLTERPLPFLRLLRDRQGRS